jgi:predicted molibdopterin-dependent oxidoreductase YjgC
VRACDEVQGTLALTIDGRGFASKVSAGQAATISCRANASPAVPACRPARPRRLQEKAVKEIGKPERAVVTTCAYCGVGCTFRAEMRGEQLVRMVPWKDGKANRGHSCVKGRFAWGYANHRTASPADDPREHRRAVARSELGRGAGYTANELERDQGAIWRARAGRHHLQPLHQ